MPYELQFTFHASEFVCWLLSPPIQDCCCLFEAKIKFGHRYLPFGCHCIFFFLLMQLLYFCALTLIIWTFYTSIYVQIMFTLLILYFIVCNIHNEWFTAELFFIAWNETLVLPKGFWILWTILNAGVKGLKRLQRSLINYNCKSWHSTVV